MSHCLSVGVVVVLVWKPRFKTSRYLGPAGVGIDSMSWCWIYFLPFTVLLFSRINMKGLYHWQTEMSSIKYIFRHYIGRSAHCYE